jgi:HEAT repeat protein
LEALQNEDTLLRRLAGDALAAAGRQAIPGLVQAVEQGPAAVRIEVVRALAKMQHPDAIGPLFRSIDDPSSLVQHWAEEGLDRLGIGMAFFQP